MHPPHKDHSTKLIHHTNPNSTIESSDLRSRQLEQRTGAGAFRAGAQHWPSGRSRAQRALAEAEQSLVAEPKQSSCGRSRERQMVAEAEKQGATDPVGRSSPGRARGRWPGEVSPEAAREVAPAQISSATLVGAQWPDSSNRAAEQRSERRRDADELEVAGSRPVGARRWPGSSNRAAEQRSERRRDAGELRRRDRSRVAEAQASEEDDRRPRCRRGRRLAVARRRNRGLGAAMARIVLETNHGRGRGRGYHVGGGSPELARMLAAERGGIRCVKNLTLHSASVLSISAGDHWLGIGAADNSMSLFHKPQERFGGLSNTGSKVAGWQLYRTPQKTAAVVRCIASDLDRKRICSGGRNGLLRLWDATTSI